jgi:hypothetical protein
VGSVNLQDQMLQPYLLEQKKDSKWYVKLFLRLFSIAVHNSAANWQEN